MIEDKDFENPNFDAKKHLNEYIKDGTIEEFIKKDNKLFTGTFFLFIHRD